MKLCPILPKKTKKRKSRLLPFTRTRLATFNQSFAEIYRSQTLSLFIFILTRTMFIS